MPVDAAILKEMPLFRKFTADEFEALARASYPMKVREGECLTCRGDMAQLFFISLSGSYLVEYEERKAEVVQGCGQVFGMTTLLAPLCHYQGSVTVLTDGEILAIQGPYLVKLLEDFPGIREKLATICEKTSEKRRRFRCI